MTYGDGVADVDITASIAFHKAHGKTVTLTSVQPIARFGGSASRHQRLLLPGKAERRRWLDQRRLLRALARQSFADITDDSQMFEQEPIRSLVARGEVQAFFHHGFWQAMDTLRDKPATRRALELRKGSLEDMVERANPTSDPGTPFSWQGRSVFLTGHTGFKGGWLALWLAQLGATVRGYALDPSTEPNLFTAARIGSVIEDIRGDIRDAAALERAMQDFAPEVVFHLAAQPLVRCSYEDPIGTYRDQRHRHRPRPRRRPPNPLRRAVVSVTTDKCYENKEWIWPYRETDPLGGYDPYSSSKACAEIVSAAYRQSYFPIDNLGQSNSHRVAIATARAGNVIGGGDWSTDRLIPDLVRGFLSGEPVRIRRPHAIRPWQHVLEPLHGYIPLAEKLLTHNPRFATAYNFGPARVRRPPRRLDRRTDDRLLGRRRLLGPRQGSQPARSRLPQARRQPRPRRPRLDPAAQSRTRARTPRRLVPRLADRLRHARLHPEPDRTVQIPLRKVKGVVCSACPAVDHRHSSKIIAKSFHSSLTLGGTTPAVGREFVRSGPAAMLL